MSDTPNCYTPEKCRELERDLAAMTAERDRALAAHAQCDRERQAALDRVRELEQSVKSLEDGPVVDYREIKDERERFRDRLDRMVAALLANSAVAISQEKRELMMECAVDAIAAIDAAVEKRIPSVDAPSCMAFQPKEKP